MENTEQLGKWTQLRMRVEVVAKLKAYCDATNQSMSAVATKAVEDLLSVNENYKVCLWYDPEGFWVAEHPELVGCRADGQTSQEALYCLGVNRAMWLKSRLAAGLPIPRPSVQVPAPVETKRAVQNLESR